MPNENLLPGRRINLEGAWLTATGVSRDNEKAPGGGQFEYEAVNEHGQKGWYPARWWWPRNIEAKDDREAVSRALDKWAAIMARMTCTGEETMQPGEIVIACVHGLVRGALCVQQGRVHYMEFTLGQALMLRKHLDLAIDQAAAEGGAA